MDLVTFATRVCKILGVETMIGELAYRAADQMDRLTDSSHERSWWSQPDLPRGRHRMPKRCTWLPSTASMTTNMAQHLNIAGLVGMHPLRGPNIEEFGTRFPPLSDAYDLDLRRRTHKAWKKLGLDQQKRKLHEGVYAFVGGPTYVIHLPPLVHYRYRTNADFSKLRDSC